MSFHATLFISAAVLWFRHWCLLPGLLCQSDSMPKLLLLFPAQPTSILWTVAGMIFFNKPFDQDLPCSEHSYSSPLPSGKGPGLKKTSRMWLSLTMQLYQNCLPTIAKLTCLHVLWFLAFAIPATEKVQSFLLSNAYTSSRIYSGPPGSLPEPQKTLPSDPYVD